MRAENAGIGVVAGFPGDEIEAGSMEIIAQELGPTIFDDQEFPVVYRFIHAT